MARKPVLEGGKKDELIEAALALFLEKGYEAVSIRMILNQVGGEVGMFYHYFKSKQEIFDAAAELFLRQYSFAFGQTLESCEDPASIFEAVFDLLKAALSKYKGLNHNGFHWSTQSALNELTLVSIVPHVTATLGNLRRRRIIWPSATFSDRELAAYILFGACAVLHEKPLLELSEEELSNKWKRIKEMTVYILCPSKKGG